MSLCSIQVVLIIFFMCRASAIFVGVYEPTKQKLLKLFPENLSAAAHLVRASLISYYHEKDILVWLGHMTNDHLLNLLFKFLRLGIVPWCDCKCLKRQVVSSSLGISLSNKLGVRLFTLTSSKPCKSGSFVQWVWPFKTCHNTKIVTHEGVSILC